MLPLASCTGSGEPRPPEAPNPVDPVAPVGTADSGWEVDGDLAWTSVDLGGRDLERAQDLVLPIAVRIEDRRLVSRTTLEGTRAKVLIHERRGGRAWHGVYNLAGAKNDLAVPFPSAGGVRWEGLNARQALGRQLAWAGVDRSRLETLVERHAAVWFGEGLQVIYALRAPNARRAAAAAVPEAAQAVLVHVKLPTP